MNFEPFDVPRPTAGRPLAAIVLHGSSTQSLNAVTLHPVNDSILGLGEYIELSSVKTMVDEAMRDSGAVDPSVALLPANALMDSLDTLVWWIPSERRPFHFGGGQRERTFHALLNYPAMLFIASKSGGRSLRIFALASDERPSLETQLFHVPLFNINERGSLCFGSATFPSEVNAQVIDQFEAALFEANFTHINHDNLLAGERITTDKLLTLIKRKAKAQAGFSVDELVPYKTLREVLTHA